MPNIVDISEIMDMADVELMRALIAAAREKVNQHFDALEAMVSAMCPENADAARYQRLRNISKSKSLIISYLKGGAR